MHVATQLLRWWRFPEVREILLCVFLMTSLLLGWLSSCSHLHCPHLYSLAARWFLQHPPAAQYLQVCFTDVAYLHVTDLAYKYGRVHVCTSVAGVHIMTACYFHVLNSAVMTKE